MTEIVRGRSPLPHGPALDGLEAIARRLRAFTAVWWYVPLAGLGRWTRSHWRAFRERRRALRGWRYTRDVLLALDDRQLQDIGLERHRLLRTTPGEMLRHGGAGDPLRTIHRLHG